MPAMVRGWAAVKASIGISNKAARCSVSSAEMPAHDTTSTSVRSETHSAAVGSMEYPLGEQERSLRVADRKAILKREKVSLTYDNGLSRNVNGITLSLRDHKIIMYDRMPLTPPTHPIRGARPPPKEIVTC